jgi:hypothetical protein
VPNPVPDVPPPTDVLTMVFLAWVTGTAVFGAVTRLWGEVQDGHFKVVWLSSAAIGLASGFGYRPAWIVSALALGTFAAIYRGHDKIVGSATAIAAIVVLALGAPLYAFAEAALLGAVTNAMLLGHWHLNQPKLGTRPIARLVYALWAAIGVFVGSSVWLLVARSGAGVRGLAMVTGIVFGVFAAVLTAMVQHLVRTRSIMSATGILYLEILLCFVAVFTGSLAALVKA